VIGRRKQRLRAEQAAPAVVRPTAGDGIARPGVNCWRSERAERFRCVQDGDEYFGLVRAALLAARRTVFILGWDIYAGVDLCPRGASDGAPTKLGELLDFIARRTSELEIYVLIWDYAALYMLERDPTSRIRLGWATHERVHFRYDGLLPITASHHQKVVVVDDRLAFSGGLDLTSHRWDTAAHRVDDALRLSATGKPYTPFHDVQALVEGPAATALGELCRDRWARIGETALPAVSPRADSIWPAEVEADIRDVEIVIARTEPAFRLRASVRECERLFYDEIAAARDTIYIESQYFTNQKLAEALAKRLREPAGPEIVFVGPRECSGWLEQKTMDMLRRHALRALSAADSHGRLRLVQPLASRAREVCTFVHSKVMIVDDVHLRIGSANLSNRSMGMDTECDLIAVGDSERTAAGIRLVRARLVGEHLGLAAEEVTALWRRHGSLRALIDARADLDHTLERIGVDTHLPPEPWEALRNAADPEGPMPVSRVVDRFAPLLHWDDRHKNFRLLVVAIVVVVGLVLLESSMPGDVGLSHRDLRELLTATLAVEGVLIEALVAVVVGGLLFVPFELLVLVPVVWLGPLRGGLVVIAATTVSAVIGYVVGYALGAPFIERRLGRRVRHLWYALHGDAPLSVAVLHFVALFSSTSVHVLCGASRVSPGAYAVGTVLGMAPTWICCMIVGALLRESLLHPHPLLIALTVLVSSGLALLGFRLRRVLLMRQQDAVIQAHSGRTEHG
jgi:phosphatidylserine/phosphatidylglycerophosphate/cardiolipin synthase-like enzyme